MEGYLKKQFSKGFRNKAILFFIIFLIFTYFIYNNIIAGILDYKIITKSYDISKNVKSKYFKFEKAKMFFTEYYYTEDGKKEAKYFAIQLEDRYILALFPLDTPNGLKVGDFKGKIRPQDSTDKQASSAIASTYTKNHSSDENYTDLFLPTDYVIENLEYKKGYILTFYLQIAGASISLFFTFFYIFFAIKPEKHKKFKLLENLGDIESLIDLIDRDLDSDVKHYDAKHIKIMRNYCLHITAFGVQVFKTSDIMWIYKTITQHRTNGIPTGKSYSLNIKFANPKEQLIIPATSERDADNKMDQIHHSLRNVIYGYSQELFDLYTTNFEEFKKMWQNMDKK